MQKVLEIGGDSVMMELVHSLGLHSSSRDRGQKRSIHFAIVSSWPGTLCFPMSLAGATPRGNLVVGRE